MIRSRHPLFTLAAVAAIVACTPKAPPPPDTAADVAAIKAAQEAEASSFSSGNIDAMLANYTADVVMMAPDEAQVNGVAGVRAWVTEFLKAATPSARYTNAEVEVIGDVGIVRYTGELKVAPKAAGAKPVTHQIKGIHIYKRQPDGSWKIVQDVWNNDPAAAPAK